MNMNRLQSDGQLRDSDNWQKGIPMDVYMKSGYRHFNDWWAQHRYGDSPMIDRKPIMAALCGLLFNVMGYMHEELKRHPEVDFDGEEPTPEMKKRQDIINFLDVTATPSEPFELPDIFETPLDDEDMLKMGWPLGPKTATEIVLRQEDMEERMAANTELMLAPIEHALEEWGEQLEDVPELPVCFGMCDSKECSECKDKAECDTLPMCFECDFKNECATDFNRAGANEHAPDDTPIKPDDMKWDGAAKCGACMSMGKKFDEFPCCDCEYNNTQYQTGRNLPYFSSREGLDTE
jgi:hypothetical protein